LSPSILDSVLAKLPKQSDPNVLVGFDTNDDAGVYRLGPDLALVQTVDFFTPIVDDPYIFGQIAAANALSDVYAMGGRPISALSIVGFPNRPENLDILERMLQGGHVKMQEAGCAVIGGHSIGDEEIKLGYAVTGLVSPRRILTNSAARLGDRLVLTKGLGTGIISTALKQGQASAAAVDGASQSMCALNRAASELALQFDVHAATDITGFGLLGHAREMAAASEVSLVIDSTQVEFLPDAVKYSREGFLPGGLKRNMDFLGSCVEFASRVPEEIRNLLFDPQTSGGLFLSVAAQDAGRFVEALRALPVPAHAIGEVTEKAHPLILVG
jgi:selenide,water dikinase